MRKDTAKSSAFDINLGRKYRAIGAEISRINARQNELLEKYAGNLSPVQSELTANAHRLREEIEAMPKKEYQAFVEWHFATCERLDQQGFSSHLLYICKKTGK